ncbi:MAG: CRISPR-associated endoribonuclease Cas6 [Nostocales cyanobacterium 94392]|nr:CRISPR-associated endoribonuclease Cas6 [Nostocales cyanobacterium 94392]
MPHSLILNLTPKSPIYPQFLTGRHLHALFLTLVSYVDKELGTYLHDSQADKAFTLSPLQIAQKNLPIQKGIRAGYKQCQHLQSQHQEAIPTGTPCWWRISLLDDALFGKLTQLWLNLNPQQPWHLGSADLYITSIQGTPQSTQSWANACTYTQLYEQASNSERIISINFATPTAWRQGKYDTTLPTKECVFKSLLSRWNKHSGIQFEEINLDAMFPSFINIHTEIILDSRSKFIGIIGEVSYRIMGDIEPIEIKRINTLADFALYAGIGRKTTMGMGMGRRVK